MQLGGRILRIFILIILVAAVVYAGVISARWLGQILPPTDVGRFAVSAAAVLFSAALIFGVMTFYVNHGFGLQADIVRSVATREKLVALTFDDGPSKKYTPQILDVLAEYNVPAAFFVVGEHVERYPGIVLRMHREGHEIGNHTYSHINVPTTPAGQLASQLVSTNVEIVKATGTYPLYVRPPRGMYDARLRRVAELLSMQVVLWSLSSGDWRGSMTPARIARKVLERVRPGAIILLHDGGALIRSEGASRQRTVDALGSIIEGLRDRGYRIVPLSTLLEYPAGESD